MFWHAEQSETKKKNLSQNSASSSLEFLSKINTRLSTQQHAATIAEAAAATYFCSFLIFERFDCKNVSLLYYYILLYYPFLVFYSWITLLHALWLLSLPPTSPSPSPVIQWHWDDQQNFHFHKSIILKFAFNTTNLAVT